MCDTYIGCPLQCQCSLQNLPLQGRSQRKRSLSENWLDHRPPTTMDGGEIINQLRTYICIYVPTYMYMYVRTYVHV